MSAKSIVANKLCFQLRINARSWVSASLCKDVGSRSVALAKASVPDVGQRPA